MSAIIKIPQLIHFRLEDHESGESIELLGDEPGAPSVGQVYNAYDLPCLEEEQVQEMDASAKATADKIVRAYNSHDALLAGCKGALAALSQPKTFPADIELAKKLLTAALDKAKPKSKEKTDADTISNSR